MELNVVFLDFNWSVFFDWIHNPWSLSGLIIALVLIFYSLKPTLIDHQPFPKLDKKGLRVGLLVVAFVILIAIALLVN
jgi:hypothetical protein